MPRLTIPAMFVRSMWDVKELTHYLRGVGHEVRSVVVIYLAWDKESRSFITLHFYAKLDKTRSSA